MPTPSFRGSVLDLGSNTFKLLLAEQSGATLRVFHEKAYPVRLGQGVARTGRLQPTTVQRALRLLANLHRLSATFQPSQSIAVATGMLRQARNARSFLLPAKKILRKKVHLLSGKEEGRLIALATRSFSPPPLPRYHLDLGGGSLEIIDSLHPHRPRIASLKLGCVAVRDLLLPRPAPSPAQWTRAVRQVQLALRHLPRPARPTRASFTGGSAHAYACLLRGRNLKARKLDGFNLEIKRLDQLIQHLLPLSAAHLRRLPGMPADRASLVLPSFLVLREVMHHLHLSTLCIRTYGLRYGVWLGHLAPCPVRTIVR